MPTKPKTKTARKEASAPQLHGKDYVHYHKDGTIWAKGRMVHDVPHGYWEWFRKDGSKLRSGHFENGAQVGEWITYDRKGEKYKVTTIKPKKKA